MDDRQYLDLIGFVTHELKGILSSVVLNVYNLQNGLLGDLNPAQKKTLKSISRNLDYLTSTVRNFLNFSRIEKDELFLNKIRCSLKSDIVDVSIDSYSQAAADQNIKIINKVSPLIELEADSGLLQIAFNNLLSNAIKYGKEGSEIIASSQVNKDEVIVEIFNQGDPIDQTDIDKLFKKFSRLHYRGTEKIKGTGIGLYITKEIIDKHHGLIWVEPKKEGNSFKFKLKVI
ncbi:MAG: HAMP domain-containing histidine kinase [Candidatus Omnitrophica bacterium]|nr:HAMP domain-containing histidine kinase [Candidatus Omnitrophota bacterium]MCF7877529.1 HAMP domain-containing histidine kinase [Candidatus Omnitrophota bacterium]MCF7891893.1 HAMP domain-containing histidine kinase [Candidatus Omnitrophota bacterium]MCF7895437.1 HAMP domain-containing histidine kinase [Candidatus Omnitrophota bacterium]MCF7897948.1 HAMP domain-containing histidine kinase [Candidatus Omnitrophota bacterium]